MDPGRERTAASKLGPYYEAMPGGGRSIFAPSDDWKATQLTSLRTYVTESARQMYRSVPRPLICTKAIIICYVYSIFS